MATKTDEWKCVSGRLPCIRRCDQAHGSTLARASAGSINPCHAGLVFPVNRAFAYGTTYGSRSSRDGGAGPCGLSHIF
ncbi:uncharacterized protein LAESUDRAFT_725705 [Laetiporus sulphureus 93-53]|uniref:Uncharacterized protein n=1 Tax=Laetiporus sulphureus 93-53 TaxID=1314785 RepID=A0A165EAV7_9APHY|nr:uncharacterized protein LAESUDRAFT_725705 [Laetiporus sulphureus 93-53]KZT06619.1 hypothetical protein LAESUDRAFT_725705 [Laetiporus sulphureus 93-53]